jgi:hypothetical protein
MIFAENNQLLHNEIVDLYGQSKTTINLQLSDGTSLICLLPDLLFNEISNYAQYISESALKELYDHFQITRSKLGLSMKDSVGLTTKFAFTDNSKNYIAFLSAGEIQPGRTQIRIYALWPMNQQKKE